MGMKNKIINILQSSAEDLLSDIQNINSKNNTYDLLTDIHKSYSKFINLSQVLLNKPKDKLLTFEPFNTKNSELKIYKNLKTNFYFIWHKKFKLLKVSTEIENLDFKIFKYFLINELSLHKDILFRVCDYCNMYLDGDFGEIPF